VIRTRLDAEERRKAIVETALPLFARKGFAGTTTKEIARAAGVSEALVFQHFPSKAALYEAIVQGGCEGEPELEWLGSLPPSTAALVRMVEFMLEHFVLGAECEDTDHRLALHSLLGDGQYLSLVHGWVTERVYPVFAACMTAAEQAGDLGPHGRRSSVNDFWFAEHVASCIAYARLPGRSAVPYAGELRTVIDDAARFILRGLGLTDEAIARHHALRGRQSDAGRDPKLMPDATNGQIAHGHHRRL
jgi:TetR/AcrR family transcriptional regulator, transcriptional repressor of aconitase